MPISGRTPDECFRTFLSHVRDLITDILTQAHSIHVIRPRDAAQAWLSFRDHEGPVGIPIDTRYGRMYFYLWQLLAAGPDSGRLRLRTLSHAYRIQEGPSRTSDVALLRFEYTTEPTERNYPRHHVQMHGAIQSRSAGELSLEKLHVPTGWVTIEERRLPAH